MDAQTAGTVVIAVATVIYTAATIALWRQTSRQVRLTREIFETTHRPHLALRAEVWSAAPQDLRTARQVRLFVKNHGTVPAAVTGWRASVTEGQRQLAEQIVAEGNLSLSLFPEREEMGKPLEIRSAQDAAYASNLSERGDLPTLVVEATVHYRGMLPATYWTRARIEIHPHWMVTTRHDTGDGTA